MCPLQQRRLYKQAVTPVFSILFCSQFSLSLVLLSSLRPPYFVCQYRHVVTPRSSSLCSILFPVCTLASPFCVLISVRHRRRVNKGLSTLSIRPQSNSSGKLNNNNNSKETLHSHMCTCNLNTYPLSVSLRQVKKKMM